MKNLILCLMLIPFVFCSCGDDEEYEKSLSVYLSSSDLSFGEESATQDLYVILEGPTSASWKIDRNGLPSWIHIDKFNGKLGETRIPIFCDKNTSNNSRQTTIKIVARGNGENDYGYCTVTQEGKKGNSSSGTSTGSGIGTGSGTNSGTNYAGVNFQIRMTLYNKGSLPSIGVQELNAWSNYFGVAIMFTDFASKEKVLNYFSSYVNQVSPCGGLVNKYKNSYQFTVRWYCINTQTNLSMATIDYFYDHGVVTLSKSF